MRNGLVLLPIVLVLGFVVLGIALTGLFIVLSLNRSNYGIRLATYALITAEAGIDDAYLRIIRGTNGTSVDCSNIDPANPVTYTHALAVGSNNAYICIQKSGDNYTVFSLGVSRNRKRKLKALFEEDVLTKQIRVQSINEVQI